MIVDLSGAASEPHRSFYIFVLFSFSLFGGVLMADVNLDELAAFARQAGYDRERCIGRMIDRLERDRSYLLRRQSRNYQTPYDEALAEDAAVSALVILFLQGRGVL
jgi:hypothetical protein